MNTDIEFLVHLRAEFVRIGAARPVPPRERLSPLPRVGGFRRTGAAAAAVMVLGAATWALWATIHPGSHASRADAVTTYRLATPGTPIPVSRMSALTQELLASDGSVGHVASIEVLGAAAGRTFYEVDGTDGTTCFGSGPIATHDIADLGCPLPGKTLLDLPIVALSGFGQVALDPATGNVQSWQVAVYGVAASAVSSVVVTTSTGSTVHVPVVGDVYALSPGDVPAGQLCSISAVNHAGRTIWTTGDRCTSPGSSTLRAPTSSTSPRHLVTIQPGQTRTFPNGSVALPLIVACPPSDVTRGIRLAVARPPWRGIAGVYGDSQAGGTIVIGGTPTGSIRAGCDT